jgi:hypothetical protein
MRPKNVIALVVGLVALLTSSGIALPQSRPTFLRLRLVLTTASQVVDVTLERGTIVSASGGSAGGLVRVRATANEVSFVHDGGGSAETHVRLLLSGLAAGTRLRWHLKVGTPAPTQIEVYNENDPRRSRLIDRFEARSADSTFESPDDYLQADGPVRMSAGPPPLVLAFFYPWYQHFDWASDHLLDQPLFLYSTEFPDEVAHSLADARAAGLDGVIVSWRGDTDWNDRRLQYVLDDSQQLGLRVSILVETLLAADTGHILSEDLNPDKMRQWLEKAFDKFAPHPAFLRTGGKPVIFVYSADSFAREEWRAIAQSLQQGGRNIFLMADTLDPTYLESFSGAFTYTTAGVSQQNLARFDSNQALRTETFDLVNGGERRIAAATVIPGYDDTLLGRDSSLVIDRANGALYEAEWEAAVAAEPDWIVVTSWNEFWENTYIEPSVRYGHQYQDRTRVWSDLFRQQRQEGRDPTQRPVIQD